jgi:preprotein translocase SecE subunit
LTVCKQADYLNWEKYRVAKKQDTTKVTRITASDDLQATPKIDRKTGGSKKAAISSTKSKLKEIKAPKRKRSWGILGKIGGYFKGAWQELRQVHWPTRKATWSLTGAVLLFSAFFVILITLLDAIFKFLFEQILQ